MGIISIIPYRLKLWRHWYCLSVCLFDSHVCLHFCKSSTSYSPFWSFKELGLSIHSITHGWIFRPHCDMIEKMFNLFVYKNDHIAPIVWPLWSYAHQYVCLNPIDPSVSWDYRCAISRRLLHTKRRVSEYHQFWSYITILILAFSASWGQMPP